MADLQGCPGYEGEAVQGCWGLQTRSARFACVPRARGAPPQRTRRNPCPEPVACWAGLACQLGPVQVWLAAGQACSAWTALTWAVHVPQLGQPA